MKKIVFIATFLISVVALLFSFENQTLAAKITETTIKNQDKQLGAFNNIAKK